MSRPPRRRVPAARPAAEPQRRESRAGLVIAVLVLVVALVCGVLHVRAGIAQEARIGQEGFVPWPGGDDGQMALYWRHEPGRYLHLVGSLGSDIAVLIFSLAFSAYLAWVAWRSRGTFMPWVMLVVGVAFNLVIAQPYGGATGDHIAAADEYPVDFAMDRGQGAYFVFGRRVAAVCEVGALGVEERYGRRSSTYWLVGRLRAGGSVDLMQFEHEASAERVREQVAADVWGVECSS